MQRIRIRLYRKERRRKILQQTISQTHYSVIAPTNMAYTLIDNNHSNLLGIDYFITKYKIILIPVVKIYTSSDHSPAI